ncbi:ATP-dependent helicase [Rickettsiales endosymbiont of Stachyamoeba lipophora]|uniref:ATP-dependent helicase n=1 Tax=Rickettsiales endosymbiont of Stachyamoeba lipophora TaxID=2486578 RepID=UPI000F650C26|nr:hypothetical protein EF513_05620 [Rickettsiales endosymbiont of Stachyamoeba lipophora]
MNHELLQKLNQEQQKVVTNTNGPLLVLSGAGTGKTTSITSRIAYLISERLALPQQILAVTFTNKAAREMLIRINNLIDAQGIWCGTFHSIATKILRIYAELVGFQNDFTIIDIDDQIRLVKNIEESLNIDHRKYSPKNICSIIQSWKDLSIFPEQLDETLLTNDWRKKAAQIYTLYQRQLKTANSMDFGDLLLYNIKLFQEQTDILSRFQERFKYIHVDEYQDTNKIQDLWVKLLAAKHQNICCVGDDDQSIYGWRGAEIANILGFTNYYQNCHIIKLEQNYRSTKNILAVAGEIIAKNKQRYHKKLWSDLELGNKVWLSKLRNDHEEAEFICKAIDHFKHHGENLGSVAILVRASFQTRVLEDKLLKNIIPFVVIGSLKFYDRLEIKDAIAYIRLSNNFNDNFAFERSVNTPKRGIGSTSLKQIQNYSLLYNISYYEAVKDMLSKQIFTGKIAKTLNEFITNLASWNELIKATSHTQVVETILKQSGYLEMWQNDPSIEAKGRVENLKELFRAIQDFASIAEFLEHVSLVSDNEQEGIDVKVKIMTLHASKGLEFNNVFLPGWEEGVFPSIKYRDQEQIATELEEERRLAYVGITRARQRLFISHTNERWMYGSVQYNLPSQFLDEIPNSLLHITRFDEVFSPDFLEQKPKILPIKTPQQNKGKNEPKQVYNKKVFHQKFGYGTVINSYDNKLDILFEQSGLKKIGIEFIEFC